MTAPTGIFREYDAVLERLLAHLRAHGPVKVDRAGLLTLARTIDVRPYVVGVAIDILAWRHLAFVGADEVLRLEGQV